MMIVIDRLASTGCRWCLTTMEDGQPYCLQSLKSSSSHGSTAGYVTSILLIFCRRHRLTWGVEAKACVAEMLGRGVVARSMPDLTEIPKLLVLWCTNLYLRCRKIIGGCGPHSIPAGTTYSTRGRDKVLWGGRKVGKENKKWRKNYSTSLVL